MLRRLYRYLSSVEGLGFLDSAPRRGFFITRLCCIVSNVLRRLGRMTMPGSVDSANGGYRFGGNVVFTSDSDLSLRDIEAAVLGILENVTAQRIPVSMMWRVSAYRVPSSECRVQSRSDDGFEVLVPAGSIGYFVAIRGQSNEVK